MALTGVDIYKKLLPKTNCGDCGISSCFTFAALVASSQEPLGKCPHIAPDLLDEFQPQLDRSLLEGTTAKKDPAMDALGATLQQENQSKADLAILFKPLPRIPVLLLFWDEDAEEGFAAQARLLFDETIPEHLDVESITFLCEHLKTLLCGE